MSKAKTFTTEQVPSQFWKGPHPVVKTVGGLAEQLKLLPQDMPISCEFNSDTPCLVVFNIGEQNPHLQITDAETWND